MDKQPQIIQTEYSEIMQKSYIDYAMSVIVSRALPDVRDGLKPVQRRTLYDMYELGIRWDKPYRKSARIVGDTMGKYHPHGDSSIYGALVVLAQDFKMGLPLVDGHGNFGSIEGDGAAAMRYTEARLQKVTQEAFLSDLDRGVVNFLPNFDETEKEPEVLPARIPNLLINGSEGIAVGMTTSIPPHNLSEVIDAVGALIRDPNLPDDELFRIIKGPDFPTGGIVVNKADLPEIYRTGSGRIRIRGRAEIEKIPKTDRERIVITEIPYTMIGANIAKFLNDVAALAQGKEGAEIADISNQSSKEGIRIVIDLKKGADAEYIRRLLYKKTKLEDTFGVNMLAVCDGRPETLSLRKILESHIDFQFEIATKKYQSLLDEQTKKAEIQEGLIRAVDVIDLIIEILRGSKDRTMARDCLVLGKTEGIRFRTKKSERDAAKLHFTAAQADAILEMRLYRLIGLELNALQDEHAKTLKLIAQYQDYLNNYSSMAKVILNDLAAFRKEFGRQRRTEILDAEEIVLEERKPEAFDAVLLMDRFGYARLIDESVYQKNQEAADSENRVVLHVRSDERICIFTDAGKMHILKAEALPHTKFRDKGVPIDNLSGYDSSEEAWLEVLPEKSVLESRFVFASASGLIKTVSGSEFAVTSRNTVAATKLGEGDRLCAAWPVEGTDHVVLHSADGYLLRIPVSEIPEKKKAAAGVRGIRLSEGDILKDVWVLPEGTSREEEVNGKTVSLNRLKVSSRDKTGSRPRR